MTVNKIPFDELYALFGQDLPKRSHFFGDGRHSVSFLKILKYYQGNNMARSWPEFQRDYSLYAKVMAERAEKEAADAAAAVAAKDKLNEPETE